MKTFFVIYFALVSLAMATTRITMIRNDRVIAYEEIVHPAETESSSEGFANVTVFLSAGLIGIAPDSGKPVTRTVRLGEVIFRGPHDGKISAVGTDEIHFMRIEFCGKESKEMWGRAGIPPDYALLIENGFARVYEIRIPAGGGEPLHTHHDRVVVCLSGAQLRHLFPNGREENSTLKTWQCAWRLGQTHVGRNIGNSDFWAIAIEPKS